MDALNSGDISVCKWLEAGTTIETAVPELYEAICDEEEWRAIVVHAEDDDEMSLFPAAANNPFDFSGCFDGDQEPYGESNVPLIRLAQMLGGVPHPEVRFDKKLVKEPGKPKQTVYEPHRSEDEDKIYEELCERYKLRAPDPAEVIFIGIRKEFDSEAFCRNVLRNDGYKLTPDKEFVVRNRYPVTCRFIAYDMNRKGSAGYMNDLFRFWTAVLLLASNRLKASTLHAYDFYTVDVDISKNMLGDAIQEAAGTIINCRTIVRSKMSDELEFTGNDSGSVTAPDYSLSVDVPVSSKKHKIPLISERMYGTATADRSADIKTWMSTTAGTYHDMRVIERSNERILDQTAMKLHGSCGYDESAVRVLNEYQLEDMYAHLDSDRADIASLAASLPSDESSAAKLMRKTDTEVKAELLMRASGRQVTVGLIIDILLLLLCAIPAFLMPSGFSAKATLIILLIATGIVGAVTFIVLSVQHGRLKGLLGKFNTFIKLRFSEMIDDAGVYSAYLSTIASHMHGSSYLNIIKSRRDKLSGEYERLQMQLRELGSFEDTLRMWAKAFFININFNKRNSYDPDFDADIPASCNPIYSLASQTATEIKLNGCEETLVSPVLFVEKLSIKQEELYYDTRK